MNSHSPFGPKPPEDHGAVVRSCLFCSSSQSVSWGPTGTSRHRIAARKRFSTARPRHQPPGIRRPAVDSTSAMLHTFTSTSLNNEKIPATQIASEWTPGTVGIQAQAPLPWLEVKSSMETQKGGKGLQVQQAGIRAEWNRIATP